jgi:hypothetical protein
MKEFSISIIQHQRLRRYGRQQQRIQRGLSLDVPQGEAGIRSSTSFPGASGPCDKSTRIREFHSETEGR